jgi:integrase
VHLRQSTLTWIFYPARQAAGRPDLRFHDLRHTGGTWFAQAGGTLAETMAFMGHSTVQASLRYQHAAQGRDQIFAERFSAMYEEAMAAKG